MAANIIPSSAPQASDAAGPGTRPTSWSFTLCFAAAFVLAAAVVRPYWVPLFLAAVLATTLAPLYQALGRWLGGRTTLAAALTALATLVVVLTPFTALTAYGANEVAQGIAWLKQTVQVDTLRELMSGRVPGSIRTLLEKALSGFQVDPEDLTKYGQRGVELAQQATPKIAGASAAALGSMLLVLMSLFFFLADGGALLALILRLSPLQEKHTRELMDEFRAVASASMLGMAFTGLGQTAVLTLGYAVAGVPRLFFFGVMTLVAAFVPLVGTLLVWLPTCAGLAITGHAGTAAALAVYAFLATNVVDGVLKPMVLQGRMTMHGGLLFLGILGGLGIFGPVGVIAGPLAIAIFTTFLTIYERDYLHKLPAARR